jgi:transposase
MSNSKLLCRLLCLIELRIASFWFRNLRKRDRELHLAVKPLKNGSRCPLCGRRGRVLRQLEESRVWRDLTLLGLTIWLHYAPKEIFCRSHGRIQEDIPWAAPMSRITHRLEFRICALCRLMPQSAAAEILAMPTSTLSDHLHRVIARTRSGHKIRGLATLGVDEISFAKGRRFATIVYDLERSRVVWVGEGKSRETIDGFFNEHLSPQQRLRVRWASCDMSVTYIDAIKHHCPNATLVLDRFHIVKALNDAVDEVRREEWRNLPPGEQRRAMKGLRWILALHSRNRSDQQTQVIDKIRSSNRRIHRAWVLKDEFEAFWDFAPDQIDAATAYLESWITAALRSRIPSLRKFARTLRSHQEHVVAFVQSHLTNAVAEGLNRVIKIVKNRASGFRNLDSFTDLIFLTVGDLDILDHIPSRLCTL